MNNGNRIAAVIVAFNSNVQILNLLLSKVSSQVDQIIIVNNSIANEFDAIESLNNPLVKRIDLNRNYGIAYAQNIGIQQANNLGFEFVLLLDQDSIPEEKMVSKLYEALTTCDPMENAIAAGASYRDRRTKKRSYFMLSKLGLLYRFKPSKKNNPTRVFKAAFLISSGMLISLPKLQLAGGMRSNYFIDQVDTEWCFRARKLGYSILGVPDAILEHAIGDRIQKIWFLYNRSVAYHAPLRDYYMFRNTIAMLRDTRMPIQSALFFILSLLKFFCYFTIFSNDRKVRLKYMLLGLLHGIKKTDGKLNEGTKSCTLIPTTNLDP